MTGLSRASFSKKHDIPLPSLRSWEINASQISKRMLQKLLHAFLKEKISVSESWILEGMAPGPFFIGEAPTHFLNQDSEMSFYSGKNDFIFKAEDNTNAPYIEWGDLIVGRVISPLEIDQDQSILVAILIGAIAKSCVWR